MSRSIAIGRWIWRELTRPRGPVRHRFYRGRRRSERGVALLLAFTSLMLLMLIASELVFAATVRFQLAGHTRDEAMAEGLAMTGINLYRLILVASKALGKNPMIQQAQLMFGVNLGDMLWQLIPFISSGMMRMILVSGGNEDEIAAMSEVGMTDEQMLESREEGGILRRNFLDFDGDFTAEVTDEDRKINVAKFGTIATRADLQTDVSAVRLYGLMSGVRTCPVPYATPEQQALTEKEREDLDRFFLDENIERWELIGNLVDWTDADNVRVWDGGAEDTVYASLPVAPYLPKNAGFDSYEEIRLVDLWNRDSVWEKFGDSMTVYGEGRVNVNTAECDVMWALLKSSVVPEPNDFQTAQLLLAIEEQRALINFSDARQFVQFLQTQGVTTVAGLDRQLTTESKVFRVVSNGQVGDASVTIEAVLDFTSSRTGKTVYWRVR